ncbi:uncharacterized protein K452DRAFT_311431 [Aplosporella prunicola CBS 121167]|uniref:Uncharacterized protein n=1 Tax=Aplosporella prunicola CBS 121167 TaxID=1176127 RepID=A0A6A6B509_9PEZI|nr:uncharacterized protein K452DRAFT_311431 [Aplosporella prunicola CBS 121167]KAF2138493.1 hypothetical protein K452DRAFT_311431 [Aplosporella prunicola CBS 121167]
MAATWRPYFLEVPIAVPLEIELLLLDAAVGGACSLRTHMIETLLKVKSNHGDQAIFHMNPFGLGFFTEDILDYLAIRKLSQINKAMREKMQTLEDTWLTHALRKRRRMNLTQFEAFIASPSPIIDTLSLVVIDRNLPADLELLRKVGLGKPSGQGQYRLELMRDKLASLVYKPWLKAVMKMPPSVRSVEIINVPFIPMKTPESGWTAKVALRIAAKTKNRCIIKFADTNDGSHFVSFFPPWKKRLLGDCSAQDRERSLQDEGHLILQRKTPKDPLARVGLALRKSRKRKLKALKT